ncbi:hypothetical protein GCM10010300_30810 [Streptomyces olivaceoviridis]|nr:hypothetical protein GCM10010300_30810 [Streptomyces olivaceoviridis]
MRPYVTGAEAPRTALSVLPAAVLQVLIMTTEHDVTGRLLTDRLAAVDGRAAGTRQAVGLRPHASGTARTDTRRKRTVTMTVPLPTATTRWRCTLCGNLTRFDVTRSSKVVEYVHLDLAGEPTVEEREVVSETIESVRCRWCNAVDQVELVDRPGAGS